MKLFRVLVELEIEGEFKELQDVSRYVKNALLSYVDPDGGGLDDDCIKLIKVWEEKE